MGYLTGGPLFPSSFSWALSPALHLPNSQVRPDQLALCVFHHFPSPLWEKRIRAQSARHIHTEGIRPWANNDTVTADHSCLCTLLLHVHGALNSGRETLVCPSTKQIHSVNSPKSCCSLSVNWINKVIVWVNGCSRRSHTLSCLSTRSGGHSASSLTH